jgi:peptidoglycan/LPS O-acetylase OafA/YrhL
LACFTTGTQVAALCAGALVAHPPPARRDIATALRLCAWPALLAILLLLGDSRTKYRWGVAMVALPTAAVVFASLQPGIRSRLLGSEPM